MKAVRIHERGGPEALAYENAPIPEMKDGDALIRVHAAGITPTEFTWNSMFTTRDGRDRLPTIPSFEFSGTVEQVSSGVSGITPGEAVYGLLDF